MPASLSNSAQSWGEPGAADAHCTSNSTINVDDPLGTLHVTGDGTANAGVGVPGGSGFFSWAAAKVIVISFNLTDRDYAYSLTGQLSATNGPGTPEHPVAATAKLTRGKATIFEVIADDSPVTLSETGILQPGNYILAVDVSAYAFTVDTGESNANFTFDLSPAPTPTPTPPGIVLVSRLSDARAFATITVESDSPPPQIQTDFLPATLSNSAAVSAESGGAHATSTSNSSIVADKQMGTLQITGDGTADADAILMDSYGHGSAKLIVISFTLTDRSYPYSLTGQLLAEQFKGVAESTGTAKLTAGGVTIFEVVAAHPPAVILSQTGVLEPGDYALSVEIDAAAYGTNGPHAGVSRSSANFNFTLGSGAPTPTATPATFLGNISTRLRVEVGDNALIGGFIVTGTQSKKVIVRAIGPSLPVSGALIDPVLELRDSSGGLIRSNDNWRSDQETEITATGIPPSNDLESAIVETLPANGAAYATIVRGANNGTGVGLVEVYDLDQTVDSKLANISTRGLVQTGGGVMIAGTIVLGQVSQEVLVRAIGPSLSLSGALSDPTLELRDGNGTVIRSNDNWRSDQEKEIAATGIPPTNDLESALVETLSANGAVYTAIVRGVNETTGIALVEVYALTN